MKSILILPVCLLFLSIISALPLQDMINNAPEYSTLNVPYGIYDELITINKSLEVLGNGSIINGAVIINADSNVTFKYFNIVHNISVGSNGFAVRTNSNNPHATYILSNNRILGTSELNTMDYGLYDSGVEKLIFTNNKIHQTSSNPILIERHLNDLEISYNELDRGSTNKKQDVIFLMNYGGQNIDYFYNLSHNIIDMGTIQPSSEISGGWGITFAGSYDGTLGGFSNILIKDNYIYNLSEGRRGIELWSNSPISNRTITNLRIEDNVILGLEGSNLSYGIRLLGDIDNVSIINNTIINTSVSFISQEWNSNLASNITLFNNRLVQDANSTFYNVEWNGVDTLNATDNYWGLTDLSSITNLTSGNVTIEYFYLDIDLMNSSRPAPVVVIPAPTPNNGGGSSSNSGSGSGDCVTEWTCSVWGDCLYDTQYRTCKKLVSYCYAPLKDYITNQSCLVVIPDSSIIDTISDNNASLDNNQSIIDTPIKEDYTQLYTIGIIIIIILTMILVLYLCKYY